MGSKREAVHVQGMLLCVTPEAQQLLETMDDSEASIPPEGRKRPTTI